MKITLRTLLKARRESLRKANPRNRDRARHKVRVLEVVQVLKRESRA